MDRQVVEVSSLSLSLSFFLFLWLPTYLSMYLCIYLSIYLSIYRCIYLSVDISIHPSIHPSIHLSIYLVCLSIYLSISLSLYLSVCLSVCLFICKIENEALDNVKDEASLQDLLIFWSWQHQKRSNSARLPHFLKLTTSKTKQFCELHNGKLSAERTASYQCILRFFHSICLKVLRLPRKSDARSYEVLHLSRKIILANLKIWCSKMQPLTGNQRPDLLTALMNMSLVLRLPRKMHLCRSSSNVPRLPSFFEKLQNPHVLLTFDKVHNPLRLPRETTSERPKAARTWGVFNILTSKCASRHNGVHFLDISTSKSGPNLVCFVLFDFEICFAPQWRALFRHRNFQKLSKCGVVTCSLTNVLRATTACTF